MARKIKGDIVTHKNPDVDAVFFDAITERYAPGYQGAKFRFESKDWDGSTRKPGDLIGDMVAGGHGIKGKLDADGTRHSASMEAAELYMPARHVEAIRNLLATLDAMDSYGEEWPGKLFPALEGDFWAMEAIVSGSIVGEWRRFCATHRASDLDKVKWAQKQLDAHLKVGLELLDRIDGLSEDRGCQILGEVAILTGKQKAGTTEALRHLGVKAYVFVDGNRMGVCRLTNTVRLDAPEILDLIRAAGEEGEWFFHSTGFLAVRGAKGTSEPTTPSKVLVHELVMAVLDLLQKVV